MKKEILVEEENTYMLNIIKKFKNYTYNWLITDIEAYPDSLNINKILFEKEYVILSTNELLDILKKENFQWIWAVFSAIPNRHSKEEILLYNLPTNKEVSSGKNIIIQHKLAEKEISTNDYFYIEDRKISDFTLYYYDSSSNVLHVLIVT